MKYTYEIADQKDEAELRRFIASMPMPGSISIRLERNPNFFDAAAVEGNFNETLMVRDLNGSLTGIGNRSEKSVYINGREAVIGYLSGLRVAEKHRSLRYLTQAYAQLKKLHDEGNAAFYLTTIVDENERAVKVLESGRGALPEYKYFGEYLTFLLPSVKLNRKSAVEVRLAASSDMPQIISFLNEQGRNKQFFPVYTEKDFVSGLLKNLDKVFVAVKNGKICGTMGIWDQHSYKQVVVDSYSKTMKLVRPFYNFQARLRRHSILPEENRQFNNLKVAIPLVENDDFAIFNLLLQAVSHEAFLKRKPLLFGVHEKDPFKDFLQKKSIRVYKSRAYTVCWPENKNGLVEIDPNKVPYLELGGL